MNPSVVAQNIKSLLHIPDSCSEELKLCYISFISQLIGQDLPVNLHICDLPDQISGHLNAWKPDFSHSSASEGVLCLKNLTTPLGVAPQVRVRESDVIALEVEFN